MAKNRLTLARSKAQRRETAPPTIDDAAFLEWCYRKILRRECDEQGRAHYLAALQQGLSRLALVEELFNSREYEERFTDYPLFPPGHLLSPLPAVEDIAALENFDWRPEEIPGIDLRLEEQQLFLQRLAKHYLHLPFHDQPLPGQRYYYENSSYSYADAILLGCIILETRPQRIIEVGSGYSSVAMLDLNDRFFDGRIDCLFIDPDPARLRSLLLANEKQLHFLEKKLQDVPLDIFQTLAAGDILFIDSSHVSKLGSDVNRIFFEIIPRLNPGVLIHIHDVFFPFEYPQEWLRRGWVWNEQYLLRAFLQYNRVFRIRLFSSLLIEKKREWFATHMPDCLKNTGGSVWIEKNSDSHLG